MCLHVGVEVMVFFLLALCGGGVAGSQQNIDPCGLG